MTDTRTTSESTRDAVVACATAVARGLSAAGDLAVDNPLSAALPDERFHPGPDARAVVATLEGGLRGSVVLLLAADLADGLENGPVGRQDLAGALEPLLADVRDALELLAGRGVQLQAAREVDLGIALSERGAGASFAAAGLVADGAPVATVALLLTGPEAEEQAADGPVPAQRAESATGDSTGSFQPFVASRRPPARDRSLDLLHDVPMGVTAELGRTRMTVRDLLALTPGSVVELDRAAGSPVDVLVNGTLIARGEVVVIDEEFGIRIVEIVGASGDSARR